MTTFDTLGSLTINRDYRESGTRRPLLKWYPRQNSPQSAHMEMDENGNVSVSWNAEIGNAVPMTVWNRRTIRVLIHAELTPGDIDELLDDVADLLEAIHAGHTVEWDGSNHVGQLTDDADAALYDLTRACEEAMPTDWDYDVDGEREDY